MQRIRHVLTKMVLKNWSDLLRIQSFRYALGLGGRSTWIPFMSPFIYINLNSAVSFHIEMLSAVFGGAFACIFFNCGAVRLSHARTL
jgi:hypothetical protein